MAKYTFHVSRYEYYEVEAKSKEEALEKLENADDLAKYWVDKQEPQFPPFEFDEVE